MGLMKDVYLEMLIAELEEAEAWFNSLIPDEDAEFDEWYRTLGLEE